MHVYLETTNQTKQTHNRLMYVFIMLTLEKGYNIYI